MRLSGILLLITFSFSVQAKNGHSRYNSIDTLTFDSLVHKNVFKLRNGNFEGLGWNLLKEEIEKVQFVLIGEQHGEAEIPMFTGKVADVLKPKALVVEIDPYTAIELKNASTSPTLYNAVLKQNPYAFAFYSWQSEMDLITKLQLNHIDIWGLNEVNFLSIGTFFNTLAANAKSPTNKKAALQLARQYIKNDQPLYKNGEFGKFSAYKIKTATVDSFIFKFKNESELCKKMLADLKLSIPIFANTSYQQRVNMMKKNLLNYVYADITKDDINMPKLLFKFGANHVTRTNDLTNNFEAGNMADNLAGAANKKTLHILIFGKAGTYNTMGVADNSKAIQPYNVLEDKDLQMLNQFTNPIKDDEWVMYDLRPMRRAIIEGKYHVSNTDFKAFIMGYDLLVSFAKVSGSRFIE